MSEDDVNSTQPNADPVQNHDYMQSQNAGQNNVPMQTGAPAAQHAVNNDLYQRYLTRQPHPFTAPAVPAGSSDLYQRFLTHQPRPYPPASTGVPGSNPNRTQPVGGNNPMQRFGSALPVPPPPQRQAPPSRSDMSPSPLTLPHLATMRGPYVQAPMANQPSTTGPRNPTPQRYAPPSRSTMSPSPLTLPHLATMPRPSVQPPMANQPSRTGT